MDLMLLPGVPEEHVRDRLGAAGGDEIGSGKFTHPESSAALAVNAFGWFIPRPHLLPPLPGALHMGPPQQVDVEFCARFPWSGGRHPWLDAVIVTQTHLIGVESKRFEPFRDKKSVSLSSAYDRPVWGSQMGRYCAVRDGLRLGDIQFQRLDAAQLVKHAFGLVTEARKRSLSPVLFYIFAEPTERVGTPIDETLHAEHRREIADFADVVAGDEVRFLACSYGEWLAGWAQQPLIKAHEDALRARFQI